MTVTWKVDNSELMRNLRAIFFGLIAFSLAAPPVAAAEMRASMIGGVATAASHSDCCAETAPCEKQTKKGCDHSGACAVKCSLLSSATVAATELILPVLTADEEAPAVASLNSVLEHPPLPPPRV